MAAAWQAAGRPIPPGATKVLEHDTYALVEADNEAFKTWCERSGVEWFLGRPHHPVFAEEAEPMAAPPRSGRHGSEAT